jgi:hypothetical protein
MREFARTLIRRWLVGGKIVGRFEYAWDRSAWHPETQNLIRSWGDAMAEILQAILNREEAAQQDTGGIARIDATLSKLERLQESTTPEAIRGNSGHPEKDGDWTWFRHCVYSCSGVGVIAPLEQLGLMVADYFGRVDLATRLIALDAFVEPEDAGIGAAHLLAETGQRVDGIRDLLSIVNDSQRSASARIHAVACLRALDADEFETAADRLTAAASRMKQSDATLVEMELRSMTMGDES